MSNKAPKDSFGTIFTKYADIAFYESRKDKPVFVFNNMVLCCRCIRIASTE